MEELHAAGIDLSFRPGGGAITAFRVQEDSRTIAPLHRAPWADHEVPAGSPPHHKGLAGDFFCAPFGDGQADKAPLHGWTANADWFGRAGHYTLSRPVMGAQVEKHLVLRDGHPFIYQSHVFTGGAGALPVANHAMVSLPQGGLLSFSPKRWFETPRSAPEADPARGRSRLAYPARGKAAAFPCKDGGTVDLGRYPLGENHEDFVIGLAAPGQRFGWTAVVRASGDVFLSLRCAATLPLTMLWHSNGGRDYPPWSSRHHGVLGVEEGIGLDLLGCSAGTTPDVLTAAGQPVALHLGGRVVVRHVIGAIAWPAQETVAQITPADGALTIKGVHGTQRVVPFDTDFLA